MRVLVVRLGGYGDCIIITPLLRALKELGCEIVVMTQDQGRDDIFPNNPNIDELVYHVQDSVPNNVLLDYFEARREELDCDELIQLCESVEVRLALHPDDPAYAWSKQERIERCNRNYYEEAFRIAIEQVKDADLREGIRGYLDSGSEALRGEMFFTQEEIDHPIIQRIRANRLSGTVYILWGLSGSGRNKTYPWTDYVQLAILDQWQFVRIITVGDLACRILESGSEHDRLERASAVWPFRLSALACRFVDLVVSPDTGLFHAAGMYDVPKIGLLGSTTIENLSKHFENDYSLESDVECAPCLRLIYNAQVQCPLEPATEATWCMGMGISDARLTEAINERIQERIGALRILS